jgi:hypothetical protein
VFRSGEPGVFTGVSFYIMDADEKSLPTAPKRSRQAGNVFLLRAEHYRLEENSIFMI